MLFSRNKKKVLIIDDDRCLLRQISVHLEKHGLDTIVAESGEDGLVIVNKQRLDLIILDWTLPGIQGIEILATLKETKKSKNIPILMLTGRTKIGDAEDAFELGADAYMFKPFSLKRLGEKSSLLMK